MNDDPCGMIGQIITVDNITTPHDAIVSPHYPGAYPNDVHCQWMVQADQGMLVQLSFVELDVEDGYALISLSNVLWNGLRM